jgi:perosamine synthetase
MERRNFLLGTAVASVAHAAIAGKPAVLGGDPIRKTRFPSWPVFDQVEERAVLDVLRSKHWNRGSSKSVVARFEDEYAKALGAQACLATANGTSALLTALNALEIGPGDEVIVPPYTFVATTNVLLQTHALPVFVDSDPETFQIDARKIEAAITPRTAAIMPVHLGGNVADMDAILEIGRKHNLPVIEDSCQAHLAEWRQRRAGTLGHCGAFSFQASKNLNSGEGGALVSNDRAFMDRCYAFHNNSRGLSGTDFSYRAKGLNVRMPEFQGALLISQMTRLAGQMKTREDNASYLTSMLNDIPGIQPAKMYKNCTRNAYHLYMFRYDPAHFAGLGRASFLKALGAEGIPASSGYSPLNKEPVFKNTLESRGYQRVYGAKAIAQWHERNQCPANDRLCTEAVWLTQTMLLGPRQDMDDIAGAIRKVQVHASDLAKA